MTQVNNAMSDHLFNSLEQMLHDLGKLNPLDNLRIIQAVRRRIRKHHGRGLDENKLEQDLRKLLHIIGSAHRTSDYPHAMEQETNVTPETVQVLTNLAQGTATPPRVASPVQQPPSPDAVSPSPEAERAGRKRTRTDDTPPHLNNNTHQQVRILTPTSITIPAENTIITRKFGSKKIHDPKSKLVWSSIPKPETSCLVIADSNFRNVPQEDIPEGFQLDVFPGMKISHATNILQGLPESDRLKALVLSVGINNKTNTYLGSGNKTIASLEEVIRTRNKHVFTMGIPINAEWPHTEQDTITKMNSRLAKANAGSTYIAPPRAIEVEFKEDGIHHTDETVGKIWTKVKNSVSKFFTKN